MRISITSTFVLSTGAMTFALLSGAPVCAQSADFDNDGFDDLPISISHESVQGQGGAGAVAILYGDRNDDDDDDNDGVDDDNPSGDADDDDEAGQDNNGGADDEPSDTDAEEDDHDGIEADNDQLWHQNRAGIADAAEEGDHFGEVFAHGDFNSDGFDDLAIGAPFEDLGGIVDAGAVHVLYGSARGLRAMGDQIWTQNSAGVNDVAAAEDRFGSFLISGDFDGDGFDDLAIGVPFEDVGGVGNAGAVHVLYGSAAGLRASRDQFWSQESAGIADDAELDDQFGYTLAAGDFDGDGRDDLAIAANTEDLFGAENGGVVHVLYGSNQGLSAAGDQFWHQNSPSVRDGFETGDEFGYTLVAADFDGDQHDDLAIGVPSDDITHAVDAGAVNVLYGSASGLSAAHDDFWNQSVGAINETLDDFDCFGHTLAAGDIDGDGYDDLIVGVPQEKIGGLVEVGVIHVIFGSAAGLTAHGDETWTQNSTGIADEGESADAFGQALFVGDFDGDGFDDVAVGVPFENHSVEPQAGSVNLIFGSRIGLTHRGDKVLHQNVSGVEDIAEGGDAFGGFRLFAY